MSERNNLRHFDHNKHDWPQGSMLEVESSMDLEKQLITMKALYIALKSIGPAAFTSEQKSGIAKASWAIRSASKFIAESLDSNSEYAHGIRDAVDIIRTVGLELLELISFGLEYKK